MTWNIESAIMERVYENARTIIYRAKHHTGKVKIIKQSKTEYDDRLIGQELANSRLFKLDEVLVPVRQFTYNGRPALDLGEIEAIPLSSYLTAEPMEIKLFLQLAVTAAGIIKKLHQLKFVHQAVSPCAFFIEPDGKRLMLTELQYVSSVASLRGITHFEEACTGTSIHNIEHWPYLAPEQTGAIEAHIDERTDLYSLGVLLYRIAAGNHPFGDEGGSSLLHHQTPMQPEPLSDASRFMPKMLSEIIMKCVAVRPEHRYQSAQALLRDLELCLLRLRSKSDRGDHSVTASAKSEQLTISETMYGRESEMHLLLQSYQRALLGGFEMVFVSGLSGIGKSFLIHAFQQMVQNGKGLIVSGKFDQYKQDVPYQAILQASRQITQYLLSLNEEQFQEKKRKIVDAVGPNGQVLIDMNPELKPILGNPLPLAKLPPTETYNRFIMTLKQYLSVFCSKDHPLIIFLDDLQWADPASIQLMTDLVQNGDVKYIMFIGAYRAQEITESHPLQRMLGKLSRIRRIQMTQIGLKPLNEKQINTMLADSLHPARQPTEPLAALLMRKTKGNPFFTKQFFRSVYDLKLLRFNPLEICWEWDTEQIDELYITDNVVDFMMTKIRRLPEPLQQLLMDAACIGNEFTTETLSMVTQLTDGEASVLLSKAIDEGLLLRISHFRSPARSSSVLLKFIHDRVYQAVYSLVPMEDKKHIHLRIGRSLQRRLSFKEQEERLFDIVNQLNLGVELINTKQEKERLLQLNLKACRKAKANSAYETALRYAANAMNLLQPGVSWKHQYGTTFEVHLEMAELNYLCGQFDEARRNFDTLLQHVRTKHEKAETYNLMMVLYTNLGQHEEALRVGLDGLRLFEITIPASVNKPIMLWEMLKTRYHMGLMQPEDLVDIPVMTDPDHKAVMQLMVNLIAPAYYLNSGLYICLMLRMFSYSLLHGHSEGSALAYSTYGVIVSSIFGRLKSGRAYGSLGLKLSDTFDHLPTKTKVYFAYGSFTSSIGGHIGTNVGYLEKAYQYGIESGDFVYAGYSITFSFFLRLFKGEPLSDVLKESDEYHSFIHKAQDQDAISIFTVLQRYMLYMKEAPLSLHTGQQEGKPGESFMSDSEIEHLMRLTNKSTVHTYYALQAQTYYMMNRLEEAERICELTEASVTSVFGLPHVHLYHFIRGMVFAGLYTGRPAAIRKRYKRKVRASLRFLDKWSRHSPDNFLHLKLLLEAEWNRALGKPKPAQSLYEQAIHHSSMQRFIQYEAMACECAAKFYMENGKEAKAYSNLSKALALYKKWGAMRKVADLEEQYPAFDTDSNMVEHEIAADASRE